MAEAAAPAKTATPSLKRSMSTIMEGDVMVKVDLSAEEREDEAARFADELVTLVRAFPIRCVEPDLIARAIKTRLRREEDGVYMNGAGMPTYRRLIPLYDRLGEELCCVANSLPGAMATYDMISSITDQRKKPAVDRDSDKENKAPG
jgi:hypothetical protein